MGVWVVGGGEGHQKVIISNHCADPGLVKTDQPGIRLTRTPVSVDLVGAWEL